MPSSIMLGAMLVNNASLPYAPNTWKFWIDHIMKHKKEFGFKKATMVNHNGATASSSTYGFILPQTDVLRFEQQFEDDCCKESLTIRGKTYIVKSRSEDLIVAFNGGKYYLLTKSLTMYIVVHCENRNKIDQAAAFLRKLNAKLISKDY
jgi:hypothetical protein